MFVAVFFLRCFEIVKLTLQIISVVPMVPAVPARYPATQVDRVTRLGQPNSIQILPEMVTKFAQKIWPVLSPDSTQISKSGHSVSAGAGGGQPQPRSGYDELDTTLMPPRAGDPHHSQHQHYQQQQQQFQPSTGKRGEPPSVVVHFNLDMIHDLLLFKKLDR